MPSVSNTSPLLNLAIIGQLGLLHEQFGEIYIPRAVLEELRLDQDLPGCAFIREAMAAGWIQTVQASDRSVVQMLERELDKGEAEAIALALQLQADWVLLDERDGRRIAKALGLHVTGVLGVLLRANHQGQLDALPQVIQDLQDKADFWIAAELLDEVLKQSKR